MRPLAIQHRRASTRYTGAGWPIIPGAWWDGTRYRCAPTCKITGLHLAGHIPATPPSHAAHTAPSRHHPPTILLPTGFGIDAIELPARATAAITAARNLPRPPAIARLPTGRWLLLATTTDVHREDRSGTEPTRAVPAAGLIHHSHGSFIPLPPSRLAAGPVRWQHRPWASELPPATALLHLVTPLLPARAGSPPDEPATATRTAR